MMQGFAYDKKVGELNYNYSQDKSLLTGNRENPALVLSKVRYPTKISQRLFDVRLYRPLHAYICMMKGPQVKYAYTE
jgi:hypothetical protein